ncbi:hypothetical protein ABPG75_010062 [Micractinium tetrahymenae]
MPVTYNPAEDPWLAPDKAQHFAFCFACTAAGYLLARRSSSLREHRLAIGAAVGVAAGVLKEVGDVLQWWPGALSIRDLGADGVGVAVALAVLVAAEARQRRPSAAAAAARMQQPPQKQQLAEGMV